MLLRCLWCVKTNCHSVKTNYVNAAPPHSIIEYYILYTYVHMYCMLVAAILPSERMCRNLCSHNATYFPIIKLHIQPILSSRINQRKVFLLWKHLLRPCFWHILALKPQTQQQSRMLNCQFSPCIGIYILVYNQCANSLKYIYANIFVGYSI